MKKILKRKETKIKKEKEIKIDRNIYKIVEVQKFEDEFIKLKNGYMDILEIEGKDIFSLNAEELNRDLNLFHGMYKVLNIDSKQVSMKFPVNTQRQKEYIKYKLNNSDNPIHKEFLQDKLFELEYLEQNRYNKEYYLFIFSENLENIKNTKKTIIRILSNAINIHEIHENKKRLILKKLNNLSSKIESRNN